MVKEREGIQHVEDVKNEKDKKREEVNSEEHKKKSQRIRRKNFDRKSEEVVREQNVNGMKIRRTHMIVGSNPGLLFLYCGFLCRYRPCDGPMYERFTTSELILNRKRLEV